MRVLTVRHPWAWMIFRIGKDVENRAWSTPYRGPIAIHVSKTMDPAGERWGRNIGPLPDLDALPPGHIVGVVDLVDIVRDSTSAWAIAGSRHWIISNPRVLREPIAWRGRTQLLALPDDVAELVRASIR